MQSSNPDNTRHEIIRLADHLHSTERGRAIVAHLRELLAGPYPADPAHNHAVVRLLALAGDGWAGSVIDSLIEPSEGAQQQ